MNRGTMLLLCLAGWAFVAPAAAQPRPALQLQLSQGYPSVTVTGVAGMVYVLQLANDLPRTNWTDLTMIEAQPGGTSWTDFTAASRQQRFYRAVAVSPCPSMPTVSQYRFEEGAPDQPATKPGSIVDFMDGSADGTPSGSPLYRTNAGQVMACQCEPNTRSLELRPGQSVKINSPFIFHSKYRDATLEFLVNPAQQPHVSLFWTRPDSGDLNRFNIAINPDGGFGFDYRDPAGALHLTGAHIPLFSIATNAWTHIAVVRDTKTSAPAHTYTFYVNGVYKGTQVDPNPYLPGAIQAWQISGREGFHFTGSIDEIRFSARKLAPSEFLINNVAGCEPRNSIPSAVQ